MKRRGRGFTTALDASSLRVAQALRATSSPALAEVASRFCRVRAACTRELRGRGLLVPRRSGEGGARTTFARRRNERRSTRDEFNSDWSLSITSPLAPRASSRCHPLSLVPAALLPPLSSRGPHSVLVSRVLSERARDEEARRGYTNLIRRHVAELLERSTGGSPDRGPRRPRICVRVRKRVYECGRAISQRRERAHEP